MKEALKHIEAFDLFYSMGGMASDKNFTNIAVKFQVSERTIWNWYKAFNWKERIELRNIEISKKLEIKTDKTIVNSKADYRALIRQTVDLYKQKLNEGRIQISRPQDLETLVKLDLTLMGEASEITDDKSLYELVEEFRKIIDPKDIKKCIKKISESK